MESRGNKRTLEDMERKVYEFKIGIPGGVSVDLSLTDPGVEMRFNEFINLVKKQYQLYSSQNPSKCRRTVNWDGPSLYLEDEDDNKLTQRIKLTKFQPNKCHLLKLHDGSSEGADPIYENMWDLTPDTDLLIELPEEYAYETALADLIDNSLQAVWSTPKNHRQFIRIDVVDDRISIFDTGPGMDNSNEKNISKWGKIGASLHRSSKVQAIGVEPPYLMPNFGMFGYGGPMASMHLGRRAIVSSKTKDSTKVYALYLEREALLKKSSSELTWKTRGSMRNPTEDENRESPDGSFTKVDILELKMTKVGDFQLQCVLKDIYFPYIQCDDLSKEGKTTTPIKFQVNGVDLAEVEGGEVSVTNLYSCNGPDFIFQLRFSSKQGPDSRKCRGANACLRCAYFPIVQGQESIGKILEKLKDEGCTITENFETFSRVSIRRLGRLLPDARWARLPFMEFKNKKGDKAHLLRRCCSRVKCFIDTDAGFTPTRPKTDLAYHNPFTLALRNLGLKMGKDSEVDIEILRNGKKLSAEMLERDYQEWLLQMHDRYDEECDSGEDDAILVINPTNKKKLGITSDVVRVHRSLKRNGASWKKGQKIKILKGACAGVHKTNIFATLEYFLIEGFQGDAGGEARIICRPLGVSDEGGCSLVLENENAILDIRQSISLPINTIDSGKCLAIELAEWDRQAKKHNLGAPSAIDFLDEDHCKELGFEGVFPFDCKIDARDVTPSEIVAVVRPESYLLSGASNCLDQKYIVKTSTDLCMEVKFKKEATDSNVEHIHSARVSATHRRQIDGLYVFSMDRLCNLFQRAGIYTFKFTLVGHDCKDCQKFVEVKACSEAQRWKLLSENSDQLYIVRVGSALKDLAIGCLDKYDNRIPFISHPNVTVQIKLHDYVFFEKAKVQTEVSFDRLTMEVKDVFFESDQLDKLRPSYEASLVICPQDKLGPLTIPCKVIPGSLKHVKVRTSLLDKQLLPDAIIQDFALEMFDAYGNHVLQGLPIQLDVSGFCILDLLGPNRKVDDNGCINLSGLLKVSAGIGKFASISVTCDHTLVFNQEFPVCKRELRIASEIPVNVTAGSQIKNIAFEIVNSEGEIDETFHDDDKSGQSHTLLLKSDLFNSSDCIRYAFRNGRCIIPFVTVPETVGKFHVMAAHSRHPELQTGFDISVELSPIGKHNYVQSPFSNGKLSQFLETSSLEDLENLQSQDDTGKLVLSIVNHGKEVEKLEGDICKYGERVGKYETWLQDLNEYKANTEQRLYQLQASFSNLSYVTTREEILEHIMKRSNSAAAIHCNLSRDYSSQESQNLHLRDIIGVVALLGTVSWNRLSRVLAEYLGEEQMCALVCTSLEAASNLEKCNENGDVYYELAGKCISGRFNVICLEDIKVFAGDQTEESDGRSRKLVLPDPKMPSGKIATGFMGYAVNMVDITSNHSNTRTRAGYGLRETLFYGLFGEVQVYETRWDLYKAAQSRTCIKNDAVSLDGAILRNNGVISFGNGNPEICFAADEMELCSTDREKREELESTQKKLNDLNSKIVEYTGKHEKYLTKFRKRKDTYDSLLNLLEQQPVESTNKSK